VNATANKSGKWTALALATSWLSGAGIALSMKWIDHFGPGLLGLAIAAPCHLVSVGWILAGFTDRTFAGGRRWLVLILALLPAAVYVAFAYSEAVGWFR
jgi:hypothetical protein